MALAQEKYYTTEDYYNMPEEIRAELIEGQIVYMATPSTQHQRISGRLYAAIFNYINAKGGDCEVFPAPFSVQLCKEDDTIVEPDISVICDPDKITERGCLGAPDWIIEIVSPSNAKHDYITKLSLYSNANVKEYWIIDPLKERIVTYLFQEEDMDMRIYRWKDQVPMGIYNDLIVDFGGF